MKKITTKPSSNRAWFFLFMGDGLPLLAEVLAAVPHFLNGDLS